MAFNKNQHFVPRCHLRHFCADENGDSINLYNIDNELAIYGASSRGQCSKSYFYGKDPRLDEIIKTFESWYGLDLIEVKQGKHTDDNRHRLLIFNYLQYHRTESASRRQQMALNAMFDEFDPDREDIPKSATWTQLETTLESIKIVAQTKKIIEDLRTVIVENETNLDFITSDDPAIFVNKYYALREKSATFGVTSSGLVLILPLTPKHLLLSYDHQVYHIENSRNGLIKTRNINDVLAFNELQIIKASKNIYFRDAIMLDSIVSTLTRVKHLRKTSWFEVNSFIEEEKIEGITRYRKARPEERRGKVTKMVAFGAVYPIPSCWPSQLKIRHKPRTYLGAGSVGLVRKPEWTTSEGRKTFGGID